jgi:hydroxymethylglutaryl-CoA lyase
MAQVRIIEVGPRDGLQNLSQTVPTHVKIELIHRLAQSGLSIIETTSFVSPQWIPQLADAREVLMGLQRIGLPKPGTNQMHFPVLVPNIKGLDNAHACGVAEVAVFVSATEGFSKKNINCTVEESLVRVRKVTQKAKQLGIRVRG